MSVMAAVPREIVDVLAGEIACGVDRAVEHWMGQVDSALNDDRLTSLGRLRAVKDIVERYKNMTENTRAPEA